MAWRFQKFSIKQKLTSIILVVTAIALLLASGVFLAYHAVTYRDTMKQELTVLARITGDNCLAAIKFDDNSGAEEVLQTLQSRKSIMSASIYTPDGELFARYVREKVKDKKLPVFDSTKSGAAFRDDDLIVTERTLLKSELVGYILIQSDLRELDRVLLLDLAMIGILLVACLLAALVLASRFQNILLRPILHLGETAKRVSEKNDYRVRATKANDDEIGHLTDAFNRMLSEIEERDQSLNEYRDHLEELVEDRTQELTKTNQQLGNEIDVRKRTEKALIAAKEEAEEANRLKSQFLANMSHELRTPMNSILGFSNLLRRSADEKVKDFANTISRNGQRLMNLINDILDLSKIESGKVEIRKARFLTRNLFSVRESLAPLVKDKDVSLTLNMSESLPPVLYSDESKLMQVLINLAGNSIKYTPQGFVNIELTYLEPNGSLKVVVTDSGTGIRAEDLGNVFEEFYQVAGEKQAQKGSGLGLSICKRIVESMEGEIWAESVFGKGSTFGFTVPVKDPNPASPPSDSLAEGETVAVVLADDFHTAKTLKEAANGSGLKVVLFEDTENVLKIVSDLNPAVVFFGLPLSSPGAADLHEQLSVPGALPESRVVMVQENENAALVDRSVYEVLVKPVKKSKAFEMLKHLADPELAKPEAQSGANVRPSENNMNDGKSDGYILVAEDEESNQKLLREILADYRVVVVEDGSHVLSQCQSEKPQLILMDIMMPEMTGDQALKVLRGEKALADIPVVAVTAKAMVGDRERLLEAGFNDYLAKPIDQDEVMKVVTSLGISGLARRTATPMAEGTVPAVDVLKKLEVISRYRFFESGRIKSELQDLINGTPAESRPVLAELLKVYKSRNEKAYRQKMRQILEEYTASQKMKAGQKK